MERKKRIIKRYRNRKLYDTYDSSYVTLEDIAELIREGEEVCVIDGTSGKDITSVTLAQIILEEEKKKESLPLATLVELVRSGSSAIANFVQKSIGEGIKELKHSVEDNTLYDRCHSLENDSEKAQVIASLKSFVESRIKNVIQGMQNLSSIRDEIRQLNERLDRLEHGPYLSGKRKSRRP